MATHLLWVSTGLVLPPGCHTEETENNLSPPCVARWGIRGKKPSCLEAPPTVYWLGSLRGPHGRGAPFPPSCSSQHGKKPGWAAFATACGCSWQGAGAGADTVPSPAAQTWPGPPETSTSKLQGGALKWGALFPVLPHSLLTTAGRCNMGLPGSAFCHARTAAGDEWSPLPLPHTMRAPLQLAGSGVWGAGLGLCGSGVHLPTCPQFMVTQKARCASLCWSF